MFETAIGLTGPLRCWVDALVFEDFPNGGRGNGDTQDEQFTVDAPVSPCAVLSREAQDQQPDRPHGARATDSLWPRDPSVTGADQIAVPLQHRLRAHQQPDLVQHMAGESV